MGRRWRSRLVGLAACGVVLVICASASANHSPGLLEHTSVGPVSGADVSYPVYGGVSSDASRVFFSTPDAIVPGDTDGAYDVYERSGGTTKLISIGAIGGNGPDDSVFAAASQDGSRAFFWSTERLVSADIDDSADIYERAAGTTTLISAGQINGNGPDDAILLKVSPSGDRVYFETVERLVTTDTDNATDIYKREGGTTALVSVGQINGNGDFPAYYDGESADGTHVFFHSEEQLTTGDTDSRFDVYARSGTTTTRISVGQTNGNGDFEPFFDTSSPAGTRVIFETDEQLVTVDTDAEFDVYERAGGVTSLISRGSINGNGPYAASFQYASSDATRVIFFTQEQLVPGDTDTVYDTYERSGGTTTLLSVGSINGNGNSDAIVAGVTPDLSHIFFVTDEQLAPSDTDSSVDIYDRAGGVTSLVTPGNDHVQYEGTSTDGSRVFFGTPEQLTAADGDQGWDIYEQAGGVTTLVSGGPTSSGPNTALFNAVSQDGRRVVFTTNDSLKPSDMDIEYDIYTAREGPGYPRPKGATPMRLALVVAYDQCTAPNETHGPPLAFGSCNPPSQASDHLTVGTGDANGQLNRFAGAVRLDAIVGNPATPADDADLGISFSVTDIRRASDLADYTGELALSWSFRFTDLDNGPEAGTVQDVPYSVVAPCTATATNLEGATCQVSTTADALAPGTIKESRRTVVQDLQGARVLDGGPDGDADTPAGNTVFLRQGVFVP